jgi:hypothetical protein
MLRLCSIGARGLWTEMMCIMHAAEPYGTLLVNGKRIDKKQLAGLAGISEKDCIALLMELEGNGVFSREEDGTIYSRRMRRDHEKSEEGRRQVSKRWGDNDDRSPNRVPNRSPITGNSVEPNTQKPEAIFQKLEKKETRASALGWPEDFREQFWAEYPNKVGKPKALSKLEGAMSRGVRWLDVMDGLRRYIQTKPPDRAWLNPETFINQERWADQPATVNHAPVKSENSLLAALDRQLEQSIAEDADFAAPAHSVLRLSH